MKKALKITLTGLLATTLLVGCGSKEEPKKESPNQEAKQESKKDTTSDEEKAAIVEKLHPAVYPHKQDGTINKLVVEMTKKEKLELYDYVEKKAKAEGMTPEEYSKVKGEENDQKAREQTKAKQEQIAQETQPKIELTQDQCDTVKSENEMMKKSINQGNTNSTSANEYKKNQQKLELCKKQGMSE